MNWLNTTEEDMRKLIELVSQIIVCARKSLIDLPPEFDISWTTMSKETLLNTCQALEQDNMFWEEMPDQSQYLALTLGALLEECCEQEAEVGV